jgi:hypothetical protein
MTTTQDAKQAEQAATVLLTKLNVAVKAANEAETSAKTAQAELVSRSKVVGLLLLEAKRLHPKVKDFEAYLKHVDGLNLSRAYDLLRLAGGRTTDEELRKEARERQRKSRAKTKALPEPPEKVSVTVTENAEESAAPIEQPPSIPPPGPGGGPPSELITALKVVLRHPDSRNDTWRKVAADLGPVKLREIITTLQEVYNAYSAETSVLKAKADRAGAARRPH